MNGFDQDIHGNHGLCWADYHEMGSTLWFDNGIPCEHPEWHDEHRS